MAYFSKCPIFSSIKRGPIKNNKAMPAAVGNKRKQIVSLLCMCFTHLLIQKVLRTFSSVSEGEFR
jgi:hypothetical protein